MREGRQPPAASPLVLLCDSSSAPVAGPLLVEVCTSCQTLMRWPGPCATQARFDSSVGVAGFVEAACRAGGRPLSCSGAALRGPRRQPEHRQTLLPPQQQYQPRAGSRSVRLEQVRSCNINHLLPTYTRWPPFVRFRVSRSCSVSPGLRCRLHSAGATGPEQKAGLAVYLAWHTLVPTDRSSTQQRCQLGRSGNVC